MSVFQLKNTILRLHTGRLWPVLTKVQKVRCGEVGRGPIVVSMRAKLRDEKQSKVIKRSSDTFTKE